MILSVIVCTRNRQHAIVECLSSIAESLAHAAPVDAEIIVVDNASTDGTLSMIRNWAAASAFPVQVLTEPRKGLSVARNCAIRHAKGDLLVFTDDDCRMTESYVKELLRYDAADTDFVFRGGGVKLGNPADLPLTVITVPRAMSWHIDSDTTQNENLGNALLGCNIAMRRGVIDRIGLYDEKMGPGTPLHAGEDPDLVFRAYLAGITIACVPDMAVMHHHGRKTVAEGKKLFQHYSMGGGAIYAKYLFRHPNFCRQYYWDLKNSVKEIISGKNTFMPEMDFSHRDKIFYSTLGAILYAWASLCGGVRSLIKPSVPKTEFTS